ncbi:MAG: VacB/RNase II family 3'-5' exoribonuclease [Bacilli bacterium]
MNQALSILKNSTSSMDILSIIKEMKNSYTAEDIKILKEELDKLIKEGDVIQRKDGAYLNIEKSNARKGKIQITQSGAGFVLLKEGDLFIPGKSLAGATDGDTVLAVITQDKKGRKEGFVKKIIKKNIGSSQAEIYFDNNTFKAKAVGNNNVELIINKNDLYVVDGSIVKYEVVEKVDKNKYKINIVDVIGHKNSPDIDTLMITDEFEVKVSFSDEALAEARSMPKDIKGEDISKRVDLRNEIEITIDGKDTKDIDDAIRIKQLENGDFVIGVDLADVSHYVSPGTALWEEAMSRGNSHYLADRVIPMLPVELSNGICSLNENEDRLAFSIETQIDSSGSTVGSKFFLSIINTNKKMNYDDVNRVFNHEKVSGYEEYESLLFSMLNVSSLIKKKRTERGEIEIISQEAKLIMNESGKMIGIEKRNDGLAENLIENFMILANESAATCMRDASFPFGYRVHELPNAESLKDYVTFLSVLGISTVGKLNYSGEVKPKDIQSLLNNLKVNDNYEMLNKRLLRSMAKARYCEQNLGHFGLASECYCHITAAIRRAIDIINQYLIKKLIIEEDFNSDFIKNINKFISYICDYTSSTERTADALEREVEKMKVSEYMQGNIGKQYNAYIDSTLSRGFFVITDELINGFVSLDTFKEKLTYDEEFLSYTNKNKKVIYRVGDKVKVECISASKEERRVDFCILGEGETNGNIQQKS